MLAGYLEARNRLEKPANLRTKTQYNGNEENKPESIMDYFKHSQIAHGRRP
jgi:hypothetical protein